MKKLMLVLGLVGLSQAAQAEICYPIQANTEGYTQACVQYANPGALDTKANVVIYQGNAAKYSIETERKYYPRRTILVGKEHDPKVFPQSLSIYGHIENVSAKVDLNLYLWNAAPEKCKSGMITIRGEKYVELTLQCSRTWW